MGYISKSVTLIYDNSPNTIASVFTCNYFFIKTALKYLFIAIQTDRYPILITDTNIQLGVKCFHNRTVTLIQVNLPHDLPGGYWRNNFYNYTKY